MSNYNIPRLKRSSSSSQIPIPSSARESRSSIRGKVRGEKDLGFPKKHSLDRRSQSTSGCPNLLRATPLQNKLSIGRTSSTRKAPSSASRSPFNRHVNDKKWVTESYLKVKRYLENHPDCDLNLLNNLKPPTLNSFVTVCNILLKDLDPRIDLNISNYKEALMAQLKTLHYPGSVTNSLLKTVNTMHAWPQVVAMLSWIVDLLHFVAANTADQATCDADGETKDVILDYFAEKYLLFNENADQTSADEVFVNKMAEIYGIDDAELSDFEKEVENLRNVLQDKVAQVTEITNEIDSVQIENEQMKKEIDKFNIEDSAHEKQQDCDLETLSQRKQDLKNMVCKVGENIHNLKITISKQCCTYAEKQSILANINEMKYTLELKKGKIEEFMKFKSDFDYNMIKVKRRVEAEVYRLNAALIPMSLHDPETKSLRLRDRGFHHKDFKKEIDEFIVTKNNLEEKLTVNTAKAKAKIELSEKQSKVLSEQIQHLTETTAELALKIDTLKTRIESVVEDHKMQLESAQKSKTHYVSAIENLKSQEPNLNDIELQIAQLIDNKSLLEDNLNAKKMECLQFFQSVCDSSISNLHKLNGMRLQIAEKVNTEESLAVKNCNEIIQMVELLSECFGNEAEGTSEGKNCV